MKKRYRSLNHQFNFIMQNAIAFGASKRSYRKQQGKKKSDKIFSYSSYDSIKETATSLVKFLKEKHPDVKLIKEIKKEYITEFLDEKEKTCNDSTLVKHKQHIESLALFASDSFKIKIDLTVDKVYSKKEHQHTKKGRGMTLEVFAAIEEMLEKSDRKVDKNTLLLMRFCRISGLRVDELAHQKIKDLYIDGGKYNYGYIDVTDGKHGRKRIVDITTEEDRKIIIQVIENSRKEGIDVICKRATATLENRLTNAKKRAGVNDYLIGWHSIRKLAAQRYYNFVRQNTSRRDAIGLTNLFLGHGYDRGKNALETYVTNIW